MRDPRDPGALTLADRLRPYCATCGHDREKHKHYREGSDCGCGHCERFKRDWRRKP